MTFVSILQMGRLRHSGLRGHIASKQQSQDVKPSKLVPEPSNSTTSLSYQSGSSQATKSLHGCFLNVPERLHPDSKYFPRHLHGASSLLLKVGAIIPIKPRVRPNPGSWENFSHAGQGPRSSEKNLPEKSWKLHRG